MSKLYKAIDKFDGKLSAFLVRNDGSVCKSFWRYSDEEQICRIRRSEFSQGACSNGLDDAIDPVLIAEW